MKEKLIIKNFGPIESIDLELGKINILIGDQATGKSTIAKILSICRYFSYIVNFLDDVNDLKNYTENVQFYEGLRDWGIESYLKENSYIFYKNVLYNFECKAKEAIEYETVIEPDDLEKKYFETFTKIEANSDNFEKLLFQLQNLKKDELGENEANYFDLLSWTPNENFFRLNVKKVMNNPLFIPTERGFQSISVSKDTLLPNAIIDELAKVNKIVRGYNKEIDIQPLGIVFKNESGLSKIKKAHENSFYDLHNGASGFQSTIPIILAIKFNNDLKFNRNRTITIEEPELNLFPNTQKKLVDFLAETVNSFENQFILPTHSPYILTSLENLMYAYKLGNLNYEKNREKVSEIIDEKYWINSEDVNAYFLENGFANDIMLRDESLIDKSHLDEVSNKIGDTLDKLLQIEIEAEKL